MTKPKKSKPAAVETSLVLRVSGPNGESSSGFVWPLEVGAEVVCPDWEDNGQCGNGLHGWLYGAGTYAASNYWRMDGARWMVLEVASQDIRELGGKVKFPRCFVRFVGNKSEAAAYMLANEPRAAAVAIIGATIVKDDYGTAMAGDDGTATAGDYGTATAGDFGTATAGDRGTATAGHSGAATAGYKGTATAGHKGTATAGDYGTATAGDLGTATAGGRGTATAGDSGAATAGDLGTATAGDYGTATAGDYGTILIRYWDFKADRYRIAIGYVGEGGLEANVAYRLDDDHKFVKAAK